MYYTFEQERFKKYYIIINQKFRQKAKASVEKDFFKLLKNSNFKHDCQNNLDNCTFESICNEHDQITYMKKQNSVFYNFLSRFVNSKLLGEQIEKVFTQRYKEDIYKPVKVNSLNNKKKRRVIKN